MKFSLASLFAGLVFGMGLIVSGMANPEKVLGFLDIAGLWDPSLAFVMGGAIMVGVVAFAVARKRNGFIHDPVRIPTSAELDNRQTQDITYAKRRVFSDMFSQQTVGAL